MTLSKVYPYLDPKPNCEIKFALFREELCGQIRLYLTMRPNAAPTSGPGKWPIVLSCLYFVSATFEMTAVHQKLGPLGVFGVDFFTPFVCVIAFFPMLALFGYGHWRCESSSSFRRIAYALTSLCILAIVGANLVGSPAYRDNSPYNDFWTIVAAGVKSLIAPPGYDESTIDAIDAPDFIPADAQMVTFALGVGLLLLGLAVWDAFVKCRRACSAPDSQ